MPVPIIPGIPDVSKRPVRRPSDTDKHGTDWQPGMDRQNPPGKGGAAGTSSFKVDITVTGPFFGGGLQSKLTAMVDEIRQQVAGQALAEVHLNLDRSIQHPTPYYETQVMIQRQGNDLVVHDRGIIYGPWLEGLSHRNQTTRFKGYAAFRRATDEMRTRAPQLAQWTVDRYVAELT